VELAGMRNDVAFAGQQFPISERRACKLLEVSRSSYRYEPQPDHNAELRAELEQLARKKPQWGYRILGEVLNRLGHAASAMRIYRLYRAAGLKLRRVKKKRLIRTPAALHVIRRNQEWAVDFVHDALATGRGIRVLAVVDTFTRECISLEVDNSMSGQRVTRTLEMVMQQRGQPESIRCDNGPEFTSRHFVAWCTERKIQLVHIQQANPCRTHMWRVSTVGCVQSV
jgi:putative transposase